MVNTCVWACPRDLRLQKELITAVVESLAWRAGLPLSTSLTLSLLSLSLYLPLSPPLTGIPSLLMPVFPCFDMRRRPRLPPHCAERAQQNACLTMCTCMHARISAQDVRFLWLPCYTKAPWSVTHVRACRVNQSLPQRFRVLMQPGPSGFLSRIIKPSHIFHCWSSSWTLRGKRR